MADDHSSGASGHNAAIYVGRGGQKLHHALVEFGLDVRGLAAADLGCNVGGFTDCLLAHGAARVYAVDTGYGALAWKLRNDRRVVVMERTNVLHATPREKVDFVAIDLGWTPQKLAIPAALGWLKPGGSIVTLIKPHYEVSPEERHFLTRGVLPEAAAEAVLDRVVASLPAVGVRVNRITKSPILGRKGRSAGDAPSAPPGRGQGNAEWLAWLSPD